MMEGFLDKCGILARAKLKWDEKSAIERKKSGNKYNHITTVNGLSINNWSRNFDELTNNQRNILIKGELIRVYDSLPNTDKTKIMRCFGLSEFSSKWYKLPACDKKILLNYILE